MTDEQSPLTFGSLFAGIGGIDLGLERAGMTCKWQVEIDEYCQRVLANHWPDVPRLSDVRDVSAESVQPVDLICGGFPCQDISQAGKRVGIYGQRSGLWSEFVRIIRVLRPRFVLVENVAALLIRGMDRVLGDLAESGYDAEWACLSASECGAHHIRERVFVLAYTTGERCVPCQIFSGIVSQKGTTNTQRPNIGKAWLQGSWSRVGISGRHLPSSEYEQLADGVSTGMDEARLKALGNAVVPQVAELIGRRVIKAIR